MLALFALVCGAAEITGDGGWSNERGNIIHHRRPIHVGPLNIARPADPTATNDQTAASVGAGIAAPTSGSVVQALANSEIRKHSVGYRCDVTDREHRYILDGEFYFVLQTDLVRDGMRADAPVVVETQTFCFNKDEMSVDNAARIWVNCWQCEPDREYRHALGRHLHMPAPVWITLVILWVLCCLAVLAFNHCVRCRKLVRHYFRLGRDEPPIETNTAERK